MTQADIDIEPSGRLHETLDAGHFYAWSVMPMVAVLCAFWTSS